MTDSMPLREHLCAPAAAANGYAAAGGAHADGISAAFQARLAAQLTARATALPVAQPGVAAPNPSRVFAGTSGNLPASGTILPPGTAAVGLPLAVAPPIAAPAKPLNLAIQMADDRPALASQPASGAAPPAADKHLPSAPTLPGSAAAKRSNPSNDPDATDAPAAADAEVAVLMPAAPVPLFTARERAAPTRQTATTAADVPVPGSTGKGVVAPAKLGIAAAVVAVAAGIGAVAARSGPNPARNRHVTADRPPPASARDGAPAIGAGVATGVVSTAAAAATTAPAPPRAADFATLVDRLVDARTVAHRGDAPQLVTAAVTHGEFGKVSLHFRPDIAGLSVAMSSADPDFAPAATAALATLSAPAASLRSAEAAQGRAAANPPAPPKMDASGAPAGNYGQAATSSHSQPRPHPPVAPLRTARAGAGRAAVTKTASARIPGIFA